MNPYQKRFDLIMSDPMNDLIPRDQFRIDGDVITLYNGVKVYDGSYYGQFSEILKLNKGVHEPSEEYVFMKIIEQFRGKSPVMVELGSYWAMYSAWMKLVAPESITICYEVDPDCLDVGRNTFNLNGIVAEWFNVNVGSKGIPYKLHIDILHCDIQGDEVVLLEAESSRFRSNRIGYIFLSTHSTDIHYRCRSILIDYGYTILAEVDLIETFCEDGIIVACSPNVEALYFDLPKRKP